MLEEIALTPNVFLDDNSFLNWLPPKIIFSNYYDAKWERTVISIIVNMSQGNKRNRLQKLLTRWRKQKRLIYRPKSSDKINMPNKDLEWAQEAERSHYNFFKLNSIIMPDYTYRQIKDPKCPIMFSVDSYCEQIEQEQNESNKTIVKRTPEDYVETLTPLFRHTKLLKLVDYCINPIDRRYRVSLKAITRAFYNCNKNQRRFCELHLTTKNLKNFAIEKIKDIRSFKEIVPRGKSIEVFIWKDHKDIHNRFILTDLLGIQVGHGLDVDLDNVSKNEKGEDDWTVLHRSSWLKHSNEFCHNSSKFTLLDSFVIKG